MNIKETIIYLIITLFIISACSNDVESWNQNPIKKKDLNIKEQNKVVDKIEVTNDTILLKKYNSSSKLYMLNSDDTVIVDSVIKIYYEIIDTDSLFKPAYNSLITVLQRKGEYNEVIKLIDTYNYLNKDKSNFSFFYQKALTLMCIENKKNEGVNLMNDLWLKMNNKDINTMNEQEVNLFLIVSVLTKNNKKLKEIKKTLISSFNMEEFMINIIVKDAKYENLMPCSSISFE